MNQGGTRMPDDDSPVERRMTTHTSRSVDPLRLVESTQPQRLISLLRSSGWQDVGRRENVYIRLARTEDADRKATSIIVPLDREASDFYLLMTAAFQSLQEIWPSTWQRAI